MDAKVFGGAPGEPVPEVDPEDVKVLWRHQQEVQARYAGQAAIGFDFIKSICKPGSNVEAVSYRMSMFGLLTLAAPEQVSPWTKNGEPGEIVFAPLQSSPWSG